MLEEEGRGGIGRKTGTGVSHPGGCFAFIPHLVPTNALQRRMGIWLCCLYL